MNRFRKIFLQTLLVLLVAALSSSCSAQAKKGRALHRAEEYFKAGDYEKAKLEYTNVLRLDPKDADAFLKVGTIWLEEGAPLRAGPFLMRAKDLAPGRAEARTKLGEVYIALSGLAEARKEALEALKLEPGNEDALLILADVARSKEEIAQAEEFLGKSAGRETVKLHLTAATLSLRKADLPAMEAELQRAIALDPKAWVAYLSLARFHLMRNDRVSADKEFKLAADLAPPRAPAQIMYSEFKAQSGAPEEAVAYLNEILKKAPDYLPGWIILAKITGAKNIDQALALLDNVFRRDNQNFEARMLEADEYLLKGDAKKAIDSLKQTESNYPKIPMVKVALARAWVQSGDLAQALPYLEQAIALAPNYADAILLQAEINLRLGNNSAVVTAMEDFVKANPTSDRGQVVLADAYRALGRYDDSAAILRQQIAANPNQAQPYLMLGLLDRQQGKKAEARQNFEKGYDLSENKLSAANQLIEMDIEAKDFAAALQRITPALERYPNEPALHLLEGKIYAAQQLWDRAETALLKVLEVNANVPAAYELLVSVYINEQKLPEASKQLEAFMAKSPENAGALMTLALVYAQMKDYAKAREAYERLLVLKPDNAVAANNLAYIYADELKQLDKAQDWASKAHSADPNNPAITDTLGWILYRAGDYRQAQNLLKEAADKMRNEPEVQYHLAMASYMMGDTKTALTGFEAAALAPQDFSGKEEAKKRLTLLKEGNSAGDASVEQLEGLVKQQPNDPVALAKLAEVYERQGAADKAASYYEQAIKANPKLPAPMMKLAELYAGPLAKKDRALELAKKARDLTPGDAHTTAIVGRLAFHAGNYAWAYSLLQEASRQLATDPDVQKDFAWSAYSLGKIAEARQTMERIAKLPESSQSGEAKTFLNLTNPDAANLDVSSLQAEAERALQQDPTYVPALIVQANLAMKRGDTATAGKTYEKILERFPDFSLAQKGLARLYLNDPSKRPKAYELATAARRVLPDDAEVANTLAEASYYKKEYARAVQLYQETDRKRPLDATSLYYMGMSQFQLRQTNDGRATLERALKGGLTDPLATEAQKTLATPPPK